MVEGVVFVIRVKGGTGKRLLPKTQSFGPGPRKGVFPQEKLPTTKRLNPTCYSGSEMPYVGHDTVTQKSVEKRGRTILIPFPMENQWYVPSYATPLTTSRGYSLRSRYSICLVDTLAMTSPVPTGIRLLITHLFAPGCPEAAAEIADEGWLVKPAVVITTPASTTRIARIRKIRLWITRWSGCPIAPPLLGLDCCS